MKFISPYLLLICFIAFISCDKEHYSFFPKKIRDTTEAYPEKIDLSVSYINRESSKIFVNITNYPLPDTAKDYQLYMVKDVVGIYSIDSNEFGGIDVEYNLNDAGWNGQKQEELLLSTVNQDFYYDDSLIVGLEDTNSVYFAYLTLLYERRLYFISDTLVWFNI